MERASQQQRCEPAQVAQWQQPPPPPPGCEGVLRPAGSRLMCRRSRRPFFWTSALSLRPSTPKKSQPAARPHTVGHSAGWRAVSRGLRCAVLRCAQATQEQFLAGKRPVQPKPPFTSRVSPGSLARFRLYFQSRVTLSLRWGAPKSGLWATPEDKDPEARWLRTVSTLVSRP